MAKHPPFGGTKKWRNLSEDVESLRKVEELTRWRVAAVKQYRRRRISS
jgi:hypothetical protein